MSAIENLKNNEIFKGVPSSELKEILQYCKDGTFETGENIFTYGQKGEEFYLLLDGYVKLKIPTDDEYGLPAIFISARSTFGSSALLEPYTYTSTAVCLMKARMIAVEISSFLEFISKKNINVGFIIMSNLSRILRDRLFKTFKQFEGYRFSDSDSDYLNIIYGRFGMYYEKN